MIDFGLMGGIYAMLHAVHGVADYWLQTGRLRTRARTGEHCLITSAGTVWLSHWSV